MTFTDFAKDEMSTWLSADVHAYPSTVLHMAQWLATHYQPTFDDVVYFPKAAFTVPFGIALRVAATNGEAEVEKRLRVHNATDRAGSGLVHIPFTSWVRYALPPLVPHSFGSLLILQPPTADFEIRIAHFDKAEFTSDFTKQLTDHLVRGGTPIAPAGLLGLATGRHTHTEVVSRQRSSLMLDYLLRNRDEEQIDRRYVYHWARDNDVDPYLANEDFTHELDRRRVRKLTTHRCLRRDYLTGKVRTFYNSREVFNGV